MGQKFETFQKKKDCLICVDSDGCAMNTMDVKHIRCFGPCLVEEWDLAQWREPILARWNEINLYTVTRGINRFQGLTEALREINKKYCQIEGLDGLEQWVKDSIELSEPALRLAAEQTENKCLQKALLWSESVNRKIQKLPSEAKKPFEGVKEALSAAGKRVDIAVVSSANRQALKEEWEENGLLSCVDILLAQDAGNKAFCIGELLKKGYEHSRVLMVGDALGDWEAAKANGVFFYPILAKQEARSWHEFQDITVEKLVSGTFAGDYQKKKTDEFLENLKQEENDG